MVNHDRTKYKELRKNAKMIVRGNARTLSREEPLSALSVTHMFYPLATHLYQALTINVVEYQDMV